MNVVEFRRPRDPQTTGYRAIGVSPVENLALNRYAVQNMSAAPKGLLFIKKAMPKSRSEKRDIVAGIAKKFSTMKGAAFIAVSGFTMAQADELRSKVRENNVDIFIAKKTLLELGAKEAGIDGLVSEALQGSILTAVSYNDEVSAAKVLKTFLTGKEVGTLLAGVLEGKMIGKDDVKRLADLPSKEQLLGQLVRTINAPTTAFVNVLAGNLRGLVTVLGAVGAKKA